MTTFPKISYSDEQTIEMFKTCFNVDFDNLTDQDKNYVLQHKYRYSFLERIANKYK